MKNLLFSALMASAAFNVQAGFEVSTHTDPMTDEITVIASDPYRRNGIGLRCDRGTQLMLTFKSLKSVATPNSRVQLSVRVDKNSVYNMKASMFNNSYKGGVYVNPDLNLVRELMTGDTAIFQVRWHNRLETEEKFSLVDTNSAFSKVLNNCGVVMPEKATTR